MLVYKSAGGMLHGGTGALTDVCVRSNVHLAGLALVFPAVSARSARVKK